MQTAFSGTDLRAGPPIDLCLRLLDCERLLNSRVRSRLLHSIITSEFYDYQISGAIGCLLKLYGSVDIEVLLRGTKQLNNPRANDIRHIASLLKDLCLHRCILADEVGFRKTKQALLVAFIYTLLSL